MKKEGENIPIFGIDISSYQEGINLKQMKKDGVKFVILRAGYTGTGTGVSKYKDTSFESFYKECKKQKIPVGAYWFSCANTYEKGKSEAEYIYNNCLKGKQFEYPIYIDVEDTIWQQKAGKKELASAIKGFCDYLESKKYYAGVYANSNWFQNYIDTASLSKYDKWVASWTKIKPKSPVAGLWQFGGETNEIRNNKIDGVVVDQNYAYQDYPSIIKEKGLNGFSKTTPQKLPTKPKKKTVAELAKEVIQGKWGNGIKRKQALEKAGYDYNKVQQKVDQELANKIKTYQVKKGDTLTSIAKKYHISWQKLYNDNKKIIGDNPNLIKVGQILKIK